MTDQPALDIDAIAARAAHEHLTPGPWKLDREQCDCGDGYGCSHGMYVTGVVTPIPTVIAAERCARTGEAPRDYDFHRSEIGDFTEADWELMVHAREDVPALLAEIRHLRTWIRELERPIVEAERNKIRDSYADMAAAAREIGDYEGAFEVACRLRDREEQWNREDAALVGASIDPGTTESLLAEVCRQHATIERLRGATPCNCLHNPTLTAQIGYPVRCPHCPPGTTVPPTHWTKHVQRHHPHAPSGPAGGAVSAPQPTHGPHSTPNADEATHSRTGGPTATPAAP